MSNTNMNSLWPEFWAQAFEEIHPGKYDLQNQVSRKFEDQLGSYGDQVNVPITPSSSASDYDGGEVTSVDGTTQSTEAVILNKSKKANFELSGKDYSLSPYDLIQTYGVSKAEAILKAVNDDLYLEMLKGTNKASMKAIGSFTEDEVVDIKDGLDTLNAGDLDRVLAVSTVAHNKLLKRDAFQYANYSGTDAQKTGIIDDKFGFSIVPSTSIQRYTPADVAGACASASLGASSIVVTGFDDDTKPVRVGDIITIEDDTVEYTVTSTILTTGDTTTIGISPALGTAISESKVVTVTPSESAIGFHKSAVALAARGYGVMPEGLGVKSSIINYKGLPIRVSVWGSGLVIKVQFDVLYGVKLVHNDRLYRMPLKA